MKENAQFLLDKAESAIGAAESLLRDGYLDFAVGRAYYAMFYAAEALLAEKELEFKKHSLSISLKQAHLNKNIISGLLCYSTAALWETMQFVRSLRIKKYESGSTRHVNS
jgi:uncharacterized protein (UPF0332 family)